jgi:hypothetical protein
VKTEAWVEGRGPSHAPSTLERPATGEDERSERTGHAGTNDGRLPPDSHDVGSDRRERRQFRREPRDPEHPRDEQDAAGDERNVLARDGQ